MRMHVCVCRAWQQGDALTWVTGDSSDLVRMARLHALLGLLVTHLCADVCMHFDQ